jgi:hypothetical protein
MTAAVTQFATIQDLVSATNPALGDYVVELYGNTYIHQNPQVGSITAYQQDRAGRLHIIEDICAGLQVSQLSTSSDGRHFAFIAMDPASPGNGDVYVYYLNTINSEFEVAISWSMESTSAIVFFSLDGKYAMFSDGQSRLEVKSLYTDDPVKIYHVPPSYDEDGSDWVDIGPQPPIKNSGFLLGSDYLLWHMPSGHLAMIDLLPDGQVSHWQLTPTVKLTKPAYECWLHNDYLIYVNSGTRSVDIYYVNPLEHTVSQKESIPILTYGPVWCTFGPDSGSVIMHYLDAEQRPTSQLVELSS